VKRILIVVALTLASAVVVCGAGVTLFSYALTRSDPYPTFMTEQQPKGARSYEEAARTFSELVAKSFPVGSDAKNAIAQITGGGFGVTKSDTESVELLWKRHAGPCSEWYSIVVGQNADGTITKINGRLHPICL
jgi:hypothetical protein